jgi:hypothetical protein
LKASKSVKGGDHVQVQVQVKVKVNAEVKREPRRLDGVVLKEPHP